MYSNYPKKGITYFNYAANRKQEAVNFKLLGVSYHRFRWYATLENKIPTETFPKFPSFLLVIDRSDLNPPITARQHDAEKKVTLLAAIGGFRSYLSITRKTNGNFGNVSAGFYFVFQSRVSTKTVVRQFRPRPLVSGYFLIRNLFFPDTASVHTHPVNPDIFKVAW